MPPLADGDPVAEDEADDWARRAEQIPGHFDIEPPHSDGDAYASEQEEFGQQMQPTTTKSTNNKLSSLVICSLH